MSTSSATPYYSDLSEFLVKHTAKKTAGEVVTHTRIGSRDKNVHPVIYGGAYHIDKDELPTFYRLYHDYVIVKQRNEYLTEKILKDNGPILVDFDFRYEPSITTRQHTDEHITDIIELYLYEINCMMNLPTGLDVTVAIMEKPNVKCGDKVTKDGMHMLIGLQMDTAMQLLLRERVMSKIGQIWDLPLTNAWDDVLDLCISKGTSNWPMYGSRKPESEAYRLTRYVKATLDVREDDSTKTRWTPRTQNLDTLDLSTQLCLLSAQYEGYPRVPLRDDWLPLYQAKKQELDKGSGTRGKKRSGSGSASGSGSGSASFESSSSASAIFRSGYRQEGDTDGEESVSLAAAAAAGAKGPLVISLDEIVNHDMLTMAMDRLLDSFKLSEYHLKELHAYTQILPAKYYEPGSHLLNRKVAFALKNTDERLFLSWIMLRAKADDFDYASISELYYKWTHHFNQQMQYVPQENGELKHTGDRAITGRSILYWARQDAKEDYERVSKQTVNHFIDMTISSGGAEWDYAMVLYQLFKDKFVCADIDAKIWYVYEHHRWEEDKGERLRMAISVELYELYSEKRDEYMMLLQSMDSTNEQLNSTQSRVKKISDICIRLKQTANKNNIMREAREIFFDKLFLKNMDANPYLLCFTNGVFDFKAKHFRPGHPLDYVTKCTQIAYVPYDHIESNELYRRTLDEIRHFLSTLFIKEGPRQFLLDHLAASLIGIKKEESFTIYNGSGSNGKSILTALMLLIMGEYGNIVPVSLAIGKRAEVGGASPEIAQLQGIRYALMQELSKDAVMNDGIVKELTGNDKLQGRNLYVSSETFVPQFTLAVCTNNLPKWKTDDDGVWRRVKNLMFESIFRKHEDIRRGPNVFLRDNSLKEKFPIWAPVFMSILVKRACETEGVVVDCEEVVQASNAYRAKQNAMKQFIAEMIYREKGKFLSKTTLNNRFTSWYNDQNLTEKRPPRNELIEAVIREFFGLNSKGLWNGLAIRQESDDNQTGNPGDDEDEVGQEDETGQEAKRQRIA